MFVDNQGHCVYLIRAGSRKLEDKELSVKKTGQWTLQNCYKD